MSDFWLNFHFIRPWWLLALVLPFLFWAKFYTRNQALSSWVKAIDKNLLPFLLIKGSSKQRRFVSLAALTGFVGAIIALAGPSWQKEQIPSLSPQNPVMMLLDLSTDMNKTDVSPNRLARAKFKIKDLTNLLKSEQSGLAVYTAEPFMITPISDDANLISNLLPEINRSIMPVNGNRPDRAISYATEKLKNAGFTQGDILVISGNGGTDVALTIKAAQQALQSGFKVSVLAIAQVQVEALMQIAKAGGGEYLPLTANDGDIKRFISLIDAQNAKLKSSDNMRTVWLDFGYYLLFIPLLCCLYFFRKGLLTLAFFCLFSAQAQAGFFLNNNQEGMKAFNQQDYAKASQKFERSDWKASSLYKAGDYQAALKEFAKANDVESLYNQGNALAKSGKIDEAIKKYEDVLAQEPNHEDAKFNLEYLKQQKQNQNNSQSQNQEQQNQQQNQDQQQQSQNGENNQQNQEQNAQNNSDQNQNQNQDQQQNQSQNGRKQKQNNNQNSSSSPENQERDNSQGQDETNAPLPNQPSDNEDEQDVQPQGAQADNSDAPKSDEKAQAKEQQYREIPEDVGGLLRAFIYKEYMKNRYGE